MLVLLAASGGGAAAWWVHTHPEVQPAPVQPPGDTGMTEEKRIQMMEEIGYIQQED